MSPPPLPRFRKVEIRDKDKVNAYYFDKCLGDDCHTEQNIDFPYLKTPGNNNEYYLDPSIKQSDVKTNIDGFIKGEDGVWVSHIIQKAGGTKRRRNRRNCRNNSNKRRRSRYRSRSKSKSRRRH